MWSRKRAGDGLSRRSLAAAAGRLCQPIGLAASALGVAAQLLVGFFSQALRELGRLSAGIGQTPLAVALRLIQLSLGCRACLGED
ncbi:MAG: hypothetical protein ACXW08_16505, partial [Solirubrobacteraceae bacterium]